MHVADADPWFFRERRIEISVDSLENSPRGAAKTRVGFVAALGKRSSCSFTKEKSTASNCVLVLCFRSELIEIRGVVVFREKAEENASRERERWRFTIPSVFDETAYRRHCANVCEIRAGFRRDGEHRAMPRAVGRLC